jgi:hypothetical protein
MTNLETAFNQFASELRPMTPRETIEQGKVTIKTWGFPPARRSQDDPEDDTPIPVLRWAGKYRYLIQTDWDAPLQGGDPVTPSDSVTADGILYQSPSYPVDGHTVWVLVSKTKAKCVWANGNFVSAADNFEKVDYVGFTIDPATIWDAAGFDGDPTDYNPDISPTAGDFTAQGGILCNSYSPH